MSYTITQYHGYYNISQRSESIKYIVVHYTGSGSSKSGCALACCKYFSGGNRNASAHYFIDDGSIYEYADPQTYYTWHCGDGKGAYGITNSNSIGIEVCMDGDNPYTSEEISKLTWLVQRLMKQYSIPANNIVRHYDASRKACPWYYTPSGSGGDSAWLKLKSLITNSKISNLSISDQISGSLQTASGIIDTATAYAAAVAGGVLPSQEEVYPFMITINAASPDIDYDELKEFGAIGVCIDIGTYFTASHTVYPEFRNPKLDKQVKEAKKAKMPFGLYTTVKAKNVDEALEELYEIKLAVRKYPPSMGFWLKLNLSGTRTNNDKIIDTYYTHLINLGLFDQIGFYVTEEQLKKISWSKHYDNWYLWLDKHLDSVDQIHELLTPEFFMCRDVS